MAGGRVFHRTVNGKQQKTWTAQWDAPPDKHGKRKQKMKGGFKTKGEAQAFLAAKQTEINTGSYIEPSKMTFGEYFDYWINTYMKHNLQDTTFNILTYKAKYIKSYLGHIPLKSLTSLQIQEYLKTLQDEGKAPGTVTDYFKNIKYCLRQAVESELIAQNPADKVKPPKSKNTTIKFATPDQLKLILEAAKDTRYYGVIYLAAMTGMRRGEILGLRWKDIDFESCNLRIYQTAHSLSGTGTVIHDGPKTDNSRRTIALSPATIQFLKKHKVKQAEQKLAAGNAYNDQDFVFTQDYGEPMPPGYVSEKFKKIVKKIGLGHLRFHSLRHTHASLLLAQGENPKLVQERLGHKDASITLNIYSHLLPNAQKEAANKLDIFLEQKLKG